METIKKFIAAIGLLLTIILFTGCSLSLDSSEIMCPPNPTGDEATIQKIISKETKNAYQLIYPNSGDVRSSIVTYDLNGDGKKTAVAFYLDKNENKNHLLFLIQKGKSYEVVENIGTDATSIDRISFADIDGDADKEILLGTNYDSVFNTLNVYKVTDTLTSIPISCEYSSYITGDFNRNRIDDILAVNIRPNDSENSATIYDYTNGELIADSSCELDSDLSKCANLIYGMIDSSNFGAVLDGINSIGEYTSEVIYYDKTSSELKNPLYDYRGYSQTRRSIQLYSQDIDNDQIIEIPDCVSMPAYEDEDSSLVATEVIWENFSSSQLVLVTKKDTILCQNDGYMFTVPEIWHDSITARYDSTNHQMKIYNWDYSNEDTNSELLTLTTFTLNNYQQSNTNFEITRTNSYVYTYSIPNNNNYLLITGDEVVKNFSLVSNK